MTSTLNTDVCRITVISPDRRVDLAVPATTTVAALMPVLVWHTGVAQDNDELRADGAWVLQRLGESPFDPAGTPESLDWLEGEELHLRLAEDPLPELAFDDLADGIATMVNRRNDRWQPEYRRTLFLGLSGVGMVLLALVLADGPSLLSAVVGFLLTAIFMLCSVLFGRADDRPLSLLFGVGAAAYAGVTSLNLVDHGPDSLHWSPQALMVGAAAAAAVSVGLVVTQRLWAENLPYPPMLAVLITAVAAIFVLWLRSSFGMSGPGAAGIAAALLFGVVVFAPKIVLRFAQLRGPQLPKTGDELQYDNQPESAADLAQRANAADNYLNVTTVVLLICLPFLFQIIMTDRSWAGWTLVAVYSSALLLRARAFLGVWQRVSLTAAGTVGYCLVVLRKSDGAQPDVRLFMLLGLSLLLLLLVMATRRPWPRRLLPIWEFLAGVFDMITALAILPLVMQLLGAFPWARGLFG
jgi:type VII secretion integral membrane protein EccD